MGVSFNKRVNAWHAYIGHKAKRKNLGYYPTKELALNACQAGEATKDRIATTPSSKDRQSYDPESNAPLSSSDDPSTTLNYTTYKNFLDKLFQVTEPKIVGPIYCCSDIETGMVLMFRESPDKPHAFLGQKSFAEISKLYVIS